MTHPALTPEEERKRLLDERSQLQKRLYQIERALGIGRYASNEKRSKGG